jgi:hypothetical protein
VVGDVLNVPYIPSKLQHCDEYINPLNEPSQGPVKPFRMTRLIPL